MFIWQYDLRNILALSETFSLAFPCYLKEEGKGPVLRMVGCWSREVLSVRWGCALQEVGEVGGMGEGRQKHLHLHLKKGQHQEQNFINENRASGQSNDWFFSCSSWRPSPAGFISQFTNFENESCLFSGSVWRETQAHRHTCTCANFSNSQGFLVKSSTAGYERAY